MHALPIQKCLLLSLRLSAKAEHPLPSHTGQRVSVGDGETAGARNWEGAMVSSLTDEEAQLAGNSECTCTLGVAPTVSLTHQDMRS